MSIKRYPRMIGIGIYTYLHCAVLKNIKHQFYFKLKSTLQITNTNTNYNYKYVFLFHICIFFTDLN